MIMNITTLNVSVRARVDGGTATMELCSGHRLNVTNEIEGDHVRCLTENGTAVWVERRYL